MRYIPTEKDLNAKVALVQVRVTGRYIARLSERSNVSKNYDVMVMLPKGFTMSDVKRQTPKAIREKHDDFFTMRDFYPKDKGKDTAKTITRKELYSDYELERFKKMRADIAKKDREEKAVTRLKRTPGVAADTSEYDDDTGLPPVINDHE